jgi:DNA helicase II / ATP-dependent DNA helicase PcrA
MGIEVVARQDLLQGLNPQQAEAVSLGWGPSLVVAGAGSGKTTVLTRRVAYLVSELRQDPYTVLAVTFTNKAAGEMKERLQKLVGYDIARQSTIGTFHSICARLLRQEIENYQTPEGWRWKTNYVIYDETDSLNIIKGVVSRLNLDEKAFAPRDMRNKVSSLKNDGYTASAYASEAKNYRDNKISDIFNAYQAELARNNALDFDDLILTFVHLLKQNANVLARQREHFQHIVVDEFQDTNQSQYELIRLLAGGDDRTATISPDRWNERSLMVVGDVDQSIYSWRKADFRIILGFQNDFKDCSTVKLEENYRSTSTILDVANSIIQNNTERLEKVLRCNRGKGAKARCYQAADDIDEAYYVVQELKKLQAQGKKLADCVVLYRTNAQSRAIEETLVRSHTPYTMVGSTRFYDRAEIKDVMAYIKLVFNGQDGQSFLRIINTPRRGLGKATLERLYEYAAQNNMSLLETAANAERIGGLSKKNELTLREFAQNVARWQMHSASGGKISELIEMILTESQYIDKLEEDVTNNTDPLAGGRIENLREFVNVAGEFEQNADEPTLEAFLTRISLVSDLDAIKFGEDAVRLMTLHSAKGLEFPVVFLMGLEDGLFPHIRSLDMPSALEEERRLMYVGVTRAEDLLYITYARRRMQFAGANAGTINYTIPSRFLKEINPELMNGYYPDPETISREEQETPFGRGSRSGGGTSGGGYSGSTTGGGNTHFPTRRAMRMAPPAQPVNAENTRENPAPVTFEHLSVGDIVQHVKFGIGKIIQVIGEKDKELYNVEFDTAGKRLLDPRFANLVKLN